MRVQANQQGGQNRVPHAPAPHPSPPPPSPLAGFEVDCTHAAARGGQQVGGDLSHIARWAFQSDARVLVVVEKDAVFQVGGWRCCCWPAGHMHTHACRA